LFGKLRQKAQDFVVPAAAAPAAAPAPAPAPAPAAAAAAAAAAPKPAAFPKPAVAAAKPHGAAPNFIMPRLQDLMRNRPQAGDVFQPGDVDNELRRYKDAMPIGPKDNPLMWWREHEKEYPVLNQLARRYLAIPASSAPSKLTFSKLGLVVEKRRNRLKPERAEAITVIRSNPDYYL